MELSTSETLELPPFSERAMFLKIDNGGSPCSVHCFDPDVWKFPEHLRVVVNMMFSVVAQN
jgi:hypothetical protein